MFGAAQNSVHLKITSTETERNRLTSNTSDNVLACCSLWSCMYVDVGVFVCVCACLCASLLFLCGCVSTSLCLCESGFCFGVFLPSACFAVKYSLFKYSVADCILKGLLIQIIEKNNNTFCRKVVSLGLVQDNRKTYSESLDIIC